ncbi:PaaI family thioesterase [Acidovorax soli]|uniref:PaaI family thioesterase n=1 Tax=Acidovorax TaxID=12916 RepID=UPI0026EA67F7|nr:PaaI family thioesterase [Acidovorax soli]MCM2345027.1 PaaI family thioesterase [Acidovorax soli]
MQHQSTAHDNIPASPFASEAPDMFFGLPMAMARAMALRGERIGNDMAQVRMGFQPDQANSRGEAHGGAIATLLDCALAASARAHDPAAYGVATIDLTLHYVAAGSGDLIATARCERRGRSISFARGEVRAEDGTLVALATGSFKLIARQPAPSGA